MKPLIDITRQLGLGEPPKAPDLTEDEMLQLATEVTPISIPPGLRDFIRARVRADQAFGQSEWPHRGQVLRLEKKKPTFDEAPFAVLLVEPTGTPNVWTGYAVGKEDELDYSASGDIPLDDLVENHDPVAGFVQTWNPVGIAIPSATACLAWLKPEAVEHVRAVARESEVREPEPDTRSEASIAEYRDLYRRAAEQWSTVAEKIKVPRSVRGPLFDRLVDQLAALAQVVAIGSWRPAVQQPMGPEEDQTLLWNLSDLEIIVDARACKIRKTGAGRGRTWIDLHLDDLLLESHLLKNVGETAVIPLPPSEHGGNLRLSIQQPGRQFLELAL